VRGRTAKETTFDELATEARDSSAADLDLRSTAELVSLMNDEDSGVPAAVGRARGEIASAIDVVADRLAAGGRLVYVGAGTSGRLALVDAAECESTFSIPRGRVVALIAGGPAAAAVAQEEAEDDRDAGAVAVRELGIGPADAVVALSASGMTPYTVGALAEARDAGAATIAIVCLDGSELGATAAHEIVVIVGPEVIAGSTRLKAGTAQKLVLNMISTIAMVRRGKTFGNLMVDVVASNEKLRARLRRIVALASGASPERVDAALDEAGGDAKVAIVLLAAGIDVDTARQRLDSAGGNVRKALGS
jgi:N-acetylmuramic acid 6-phosphate etherase